jgi:hypothetical protein
MKTSIYAISKCIVALLLLAPLAGCAGYKLGSNLPSNVHSVAVPVFVNQTGEPALETPTTSATIQEFQKDGSLKVADRNTADTIVEVTLKKYKLTPLRYRSDKATTAREYRMTLTAEVTWRRLPSMEIISPATRVEGYTDFEALTDLPSARRDALPDAALDLAHRIVRSIVEYW